MIAQSELACLAIADISGYTGYLAGVELDHAQDILADLMGTVVEAMLPFRLAKLEGDAAFAWVPGDVMDGSLMQDAMEGTYVAFRRRLRDIKQASSCDCNACVLIPRLDLKLVVHHGRVARQRIVGWEELVGSDVILVHRLLKNRVEEQLGLAAYALYTQAAIDAGGIDPHAQALREHHEVTDVAGEVVTWVRDLEARWQAVSSQPREEIPPDRVQRTWVQEYPVPPAVVWDYITLPSRRPQWAGGVTEVVEDSPDGRRGPGTTNHCMHGPDAVLEQILDWHPPHYWLTLVTASFLPGAPQALLSDELIALPDGRTRVVSRAGPPEGVDERAFAVAFAPLEPAVEESARELRQALEAEVSRAAEAPAWSVPLPASRGRHLAEPARPG